MSAGLGGYGSDASFSHAVRQSAGGPPVSTASNSAERLEAQTDRSRALW